jgi:hypothetical protein
MIPSNKTAIIAGAWSVLGLVPFEHWIDHEHFSVIKHNVIWLCAAAVFFFIPALYLVIGRNNEPFSRMWFLDPVQRARYWVISKRMMAWFLSAGVIGSLWSGILSLLFWAK